MSALAPALAPAPPSGTIHSTAAPIETTTTTARRRRPRSDSGGGCIVRSSRSRLTTTTTTTMPATSTHILAAATATMLLLLLCLIPDPAWAFSIREGTAVVAGRGRCCRERTRPSRTTTAPPLDAATAAPSSRSQAGRLYSAPYSSSGDALAPPEQPLMERGDARGAALLLEDVSVSLGGGADVLRNVHWRVEPKSKWGLVGSNGCGKSTLLRAIVGEVPHRHGQGKTGRGGGGNGGITVGTTQTVGYLQQTAVAGSTRTVFDEAASAMGDIRAARDQLRRAEERVAAHGGGGGGGADASALERDLKALDRATRKYEDVGGYTQERDVSNMLHGLGFTNLTQRCDELSGGWQMRVSFAKLLLSKPSLCLLDEPGNHLDRPARKWLAQYLRTYDDGAMVLVTHDRELLDSCDHIAEIVSGTGTLQTYKSCTYSQYLARKEERATAATAEFERNQAKAAKLQGFVDRFGASANKASAAQSRVKQLEKMQAKGELDAPPDAVLQVERFKPVLNLPSPPRPVGEVLLALQADAKVGYDERAPLVSNIRNLEIKRGMKILVRGPNGAGKTTLMDTLRGTLPLLGGERVENPTLRLGVFTQDLAQELDTSARAVDLVTAHARTGRDGDVHVSDQQARTVMGGLGLQGGKALRLVGQLSGGEKARVALAMFALKPSNLYLLDEVSNHLDVECVEALGEALSGWGGRGDDDSGGGDGALVVISHDRAFCEQVGFTHVLTVQGGGLKLEQRNAQERDWDSSVATFQPSNDVGNGTPANTPATTTTATTSTSTSFLGPTDPKLRKQAFNAPKRIGRIEILVEQKEGQIAKLDDEMMANGNDVGKLVDLTKAKEALENEVMELMEEWEELETLLAQVEAETGVVSS